MSLKTRNAYGSVTVSEDVIASVAGSLAMESYGVIDMIPSNFSDTLSDVFKRNGKSRGVRIVTNGDRIFVELFLVLKYGLPISAVASSVKESVKYGLERFTGMIVEKIDVHVVGVKL